MKIVVPSIVAVVALLTIAMLATAGWERPPIETVQRGFRGNAMEHVFNPRTEAARIAANEAPPAIYPLEPSDAPLVRDVYENIEILGDINEDQFLRLMASITEWVSPEEGCAYCHDEEDLADGSMYTYQVSRRMIQMTQAINAGWQNHVADTGVTCYTCHRGQPVPAEIWFDAEDGGPTRSMAAANYGQNTPAPSVGLTSLPANPLGAYFSDAGELRVVGPTPLPTTEGVSLQDTEASYALMIHMSQGLGVNCTYCHNTQSFQNWDTSTPQRATSWHAIRMMREVNGTYLEPLQSLYPEDRLGPTGDAPKANCTTCHMGVYKPLYGAPMLAEFPSLAGN